MPEYHEAHEPYMGAVVDALEAAGLEVKEWFADANDPRDGCITLVGADEDGHDLSERLGATDPGLRDEILKALDGTETPA